MDYLRSVFVRKQVRFLISAGACLVVGLILVLIGVKTTGKLEDQQFAKRWCDDNSYAQASAYFSEVAGFTDENAKELAYKIESKLTQDSISPKTEDSRMIVYSYCANGKVNVKSSNSSADVKAIGVDGDFFMFHPLELIEGSFFDGTEVNKDLVVIDENTAWVLFGSSNVVGQVVEIGGMQHIVCGVVKRETGRLNDLAGNKEPTLYLSYESLSKNGFVSYINTFEILMPNPLTGYATAAIKELCPVDVERVEIIENSGRFKWTKLLMNVKNFGTRGMNGKGVIYPYWENIARGYEDYLTPVTVLAVLCFAYASINVFVLLIRMIKLRTIHREDIKDFIERRIEEQRERRKKVKEGEIYE